MIGTYPPLIKKKKSYSKAKVNRDSRVTLVHKAAVPLPVKIEP